MGRAKKKKTAVVFTRDVRIALAVSAVMGLWIGYSRFLGVLWPDHLVPTLMSIQKWTPYYWQQDRYGSLVQWLAIPFRNPFHNLAMQAAITSFMALGTFFLLARLAVGSGVWMGAGAVSAALCLGLQRDSDMVQYFAVNHALQSMAPTLLGWWLIEELASGPKLLRWALGAALVFVGFWVDPTSVLILGGMAAFKYGWQKGDAASLGAWMAYLAFAAWFNIELTKSSGYYTNAYGLNPAFLWPENWRKLLWRMGELLSPGGTGWLWAAGFGLGAWAWWNQKRRVWAGSWLTIAAGGTAYFLVVGTSGWVRSQLYDPRFVIQSFVIWSVCAVGAGFWSLHLQRPKWNWRRIQYGCLVLIPIAAALRYGPPSIANAKEAVDTTFGKWTAGIQAAGCDYMIGSYNAVWRATFHVNWVRYENGDPRPFWGITYRSHPTIPEWWGGAVQASCWASDADDQEVAEQVSNYGLPAFAPTEKIGNVTVWRQRR